MSLYDELSQAAELEPEKGEAENAFLDRLARAAGGLDEDNFHKLSDPAQDWVNDAIIAIKHKNPIADLPGAPFEAVAAKYPTTWRAFLGLMGEHAPDVLDRLHVVRAASCDVTVPCADVVFIDAAHDEANVRADIDHWRTMVKPGGWLRGHDYQDAYPGVQAAVRAKLRDPEMGPGDWSSVWIVRQWSLLPPPPGGPARHGQ